MKRVLKLSIISLVRAQLKHSQETFLSVQAVRAKQIS